MVCAASTPSTPGVDFEHADQVGESRRRTLLRRGACAMSTSAPGLNTTSASVRTDHDFTSHSIRCLITPSIGIDVAQSGAFAPAAHVPEVTTARP